MPTAIAAIGKTNSERYGMSSQAASNPPIIGNMVSITVQEPGLFLETGSRRNITWTMKVAAGKISIPPKNKTAKPIGTLDTDAANPAANQTTPETMAPGPPRK